jgi:catechol 2,3-dioxygenase-like lactoylglutathione lyase family enzyme
MDREAPETKAVEAGDSSLDAQIDHIAVRAADVNATIAFYQRLFGSKHARLYDSASDFGRVDMVAVDGQAWIETFEPGFGYASVEGPAVGLVHFAFNVPDVDAAYQRALDAGAASLRGPAEVELPSQPGVRPRTAFVYGPNGEVIEFINRGWKAQLKWSREEASQP